MLKRTPILADRDSSSITTKKLKTMKNFKDQQKKNQL